MSNHGGQLSLAWPRGVERGWLPGEPVPFDTRGMGESDVDARVRELVVNDVRRAVAAMEQELGGALERYVRHRRSARAKLGVEDICQEVWRSVHRGLPRFRFEAPLRAWLFGIAARRLIDVARQGPVDDRVDTARATAIADSLTGPLSRLLREERAAAVRAAIARCDPEDAELLHLRFTLDLKPAEISYLRAAETGQPPEPANTVAKRIARLLVKLGRELAKDEVFHPRSETP
jgi:RNA polymerase sigma-70 factor (ECF subfamily)